MHPQRDERPSHVPLSTRGLNGLSSSTSAEPAIARIWHPCFEDHALVVVNQILHKTGGIIRDEAREYSTLASFPAFLCVPNLVT